MQTTVRHSAGLSDFPALMAQIASYRKTGWPAPRQEPKVHVSAVLKDEAEEAIQQVLDAIQGRMTCYQITSSATGMNSNTVNKRLLILRERGKVDRTDRMPYLYFKVTP